MLKINTIKMKRVVLIELAGKADSYYALEIKKLLDQAIAEGTNQFIIDMSQVEYLSSAVLQQIKNTLVSCRKKAGDVRIANPSDCVREVLMLAGLDTIFKIYPTQVEAVGSF